MSETADFFRSRLDQTIELRHPLAVMASSIQWQELEANIAHLFAKKARAGKAISDEGSFAAWPRWWAWACGRLVVRACRLG